MRSRIAAVLLGCSSLTLACTPTGEPEPESDGLTPGEVPCNDPVTAADRPELAEPTPRSQRVERAAPSLAHEVELDPRGQVAITVDRLGHVSLWPKLDSTDARTSTPYPLPIEEPLWISVAVAGDGSYLVATIDTANAGQVLAVKPDADQAEVTELFALAPSDPLLEIHALDGGQRILALGVDHRIRLYDRAGTLLSVLDQRGFAPWQLRVAYGPDSIPKLAAILSPSKVQRIALIDDQLSLVGEAQQVALDRGPNRNDLLLSPDGKTVATLRRESDKTSAFTIQLIDLETNGRRLIAGQTKTTLRSRMYFVDEGRILLETGNPRGQGLWLDLDTAVAITDLADADPESKFAIALAKTDHPSIPLPGSAEHKPEFFEPGFSPDWDQGDRYHASVANGIRVTIERMHGFPVGLIVDPLATDRHLRFGAGVGHFERPTIDWTGRCSAAVVGAMIHVREIDKPDAPIQEFAHGLGDPKLLAFVDEARVAMIDSKGVLGLFDASTGTSTSTTKLDITDGFESVEFLASDVEGGLFGWRGRQRNDPIMLLPIRAGVIGPSAELVGDQRFSWPNLAPKPTIDEFAELLGLAPREVRSIDEYTVGGGLWLYTDDSPRTPLFVVSSGEARTIELPAGQARELRLSHNHSKLAIVQFRERDDSSFVEDHLLSVIVVETGERLWTTGQTGQIEAPTWAGDDRRILAHGSIRDAITGELVADFGPSAVRVDDRADADWVGAAEE